MKFTQEQLTKAKAAKSAEELFAYANEIGYKLTEEEAKNFFEQWHKEGELADEELDNVAGGTCYSSGVWGPNGYKNYAIVTAANSCSGSDVANLSYRTIHNICANCSHSFSAGATLYCAIREEGNDPYSD